jgi:hypothetical protein
VDRRVRRAVLERLAAVEEMAVRADISGPSPMVGVSCSSSTSRTPPAAAPFARDGYAVAAGPAMCG